MAGRHTRLTKVVTQMEVAEKELAAYLRRAATTNGEDLATGRSEAPMLSTKGAGLFCYYHMVQGSCPREAALGLHTGLVSPTVANQIP